MEGTAPERWLVGGAGTAATRGRVLIFAGVGDRASVDRYGVLTRECRAAGGFRPRGCIGVATCGRCLLTRGDLRRKSRWGGMRDGLRREGFAVAPTVEFREGFDCSAAKLWRGGRLVGDRDIGLAQFDWRAAVA